uniref:Phospholipase A2 inhibitor gamma subunit B n=1 Tax=Elaphe climacophora TaxID=31143 RepID=PLIGB_ELACL|nr:RecName: Full=Phospholipase A2 inhibitor gamma subunit B; AltName: Full=PLI-gamma B; AltName: Full=gamma-PLI B; Flags: Precursor [Elaphe climacophora]BAH47551.1 phospholipase A2 inhibitor gamma B subunit [Elaphe climacophora]
MKFLLFCCLFGTFLATGMCIDCEHCVVWGQNCTGWKETCGENEDTCVTYQTEVIRPPLSITFTAKTCGTSDTCHLDYVEANPHNELTLRAKRACCTGDECQTLPPPVLEPQVNRPNGLQCPGCIGLTSTECNEYLVSCQGSENQCLTIILKKPDFSLSEMSFKGCASENLCLLFEKKFWRFLEASEVDVKCTPAVPQTSQ